ncbi:hypothetical protein A9Q98_06440 [Thalassotalea sp. 42_200_T64]|nr:hypothetical protein A9Q98_06440 [Thalassotalea sp. 42_200_T64]
MKLHNLDIHAFGPFADHEHIDFSDLGDNPLFLIDGPTGAGKSSILHAICYALYGETTDEARKDMGVRCDNAFAETLTELSLEFSIRGKHYRITRTPTQMRKAKRGDGVTEQKAAAHLRKVLANGDEETLVAKKKKDADEQIKQIIGLSVEQFRQVMVLPQGKFRELLLAKSDARQAILSTLFQTEIFKRIEFLLKDKAAHIDRIYKKYKEQIEETLNEVFVANVDQLKTSIRDAEQQQNELNTIKVAADKSKQLALNDLKMAENLAKAFNDKASKQQQLHTHLVNKTEVEQQKDELGLAEKASAIAPKYKALCQVVNDIKQNSVQLEQAKALQQQKQQQLQQHQAMLALMNKNCLNRDPLRAQLNQLQGYSHTLADFANVQQSAVRAAKDEQALIALQQEATEKLAELTRRSKNGQLHIEDLQQKTVNKVQVLLQQSQLQQQISLATKVAQTLAASHQQQQKITQLTQAFSQAEHDYKLATQGANKIEMLWHSNQAAVLAKTLHQDAPCPVCGSIEHPSPATLTSGMEDISKQKVDDARALQSQKQTAKSQLDKALAQADEVLNQYQQQLQKLNTELGDAANSTLDNLKAQLRDINLQTEFILNTEKQIPAAMKKLQAMESHLTPLAEKIEQLTAQLPNLTAKSSSAQTLLNTAEQALPAQYREQSALTAAMNQCQQGINKLDSDLQHAQQQQQQTSNECSAIKAKVEELTKQQLGLTQRETEQANIWQQALSDSDFANIAAFEIATASVAKMQSLQQQITAFEQSTQTLTSELNLLSEQLSDKQPPNIDTLADKESQQHLNYQQAEQYWAQAQNKLSKLNDTLTKISRLENEQSENKKQFEVIGTLAAAAGGRGKVRVSLERFVLGDLLDSVLAIASKRLHIMSKGQYRLVRQNEETQKKNVTAGLDLAIDDAYTGKTRPVATLSGGESFMASLSLALGLSDVVQQRSGGIQLDTLFIDEGFGSLDQESLQLAIQTLIDLQATGRTIGIISHVSELKEQMALRIDVKSSREGSSISTVTQ